MGYISFWAYQDAFKVDRNGYLGIMLHYYNINVYMLLCYHYLFMSV